MLVEIQVSAALKRALEEQAERAGRTLSEHLAVLVEEDQQRQYFDAVRRAMEANPPDEEYLRELQQWQSDVWD